MILDLTYTGFDQKKFITGVDFVPYYQFEYSVQPFVHVMTTYIQARMGNEVVFILQNDQGSVSAMFSRLFFK